jgi:hypothetical protein
MDPIKLRPEQSRQEDETGEKSVQKNTESLTKPQLNWLQKKWYFFAQQNKLS